MIITIKLHIVYINAIHILDSAKDKNTVIKNDSLTLWNEISFFNTLSKKIVITNVYKGSSGINALPFKYNPPFNT